ncbi:hypothetical protein LZ318_39185 [Saccharopolyspora indica]|uniref:hypothetical protein n=1 Tax=Saccharopolyspora indica TaxID=1229659 RepID=UPI0022EB4A26|nr:hypothetical protein [Saccharopolyspora indica]MDA3642612.1 hypothetical protein [Saccharopolyspora indica]
MELNAEFDVETDGTHLNLVLESAGGRTAGNERPRNDQYVPALTLLLIRLRARHAVLLSATVVSKRVAGLPEKDRALVNGPLDLGAVDDIDRLRLDLTSAQGRVGLPAGATKEGNNRKRIQLLLAVPGYGPGDATRLAADLAAPDTPSSLAVNPFTRDGLLSAVRKLSLHRHEGRPSLHKPLALLWAIGRVADGRCRLVSWPEFRGEVGALLAEFGHEHSKTTPQYPFWHLRTSPQVWEVHGLADVPTAGDVTAVAGLTHQAAELLRDDTTRADVVGLLLEEHLRGITDHQTLLARVGLGGTHIALPGARTLLRALVGEQIRTASEESHTVLAVHGDAALVRTDGSPSGQSLRISEVQKGLDLLAVRGSVHLHVDELGHRCSLIGAVLATLPGARFTEDPTAVTLHAPTSTRVAEDPHFGGLDTVAQVKVRTEQAQLRRLLAGDRDAAECALCGHHFPMSFLVAAHIKKRAVCSNSEREDLHQVAMLACSLGCDALYESGWITVNADGHVETAPPDMAPAGRFRDQLLHLNGRRCTAHRQESEPYFAWHRETVFRRTSD